MDIIAAWNRIGETPLQTLHRVREDYKIPESVKGSYTGRLDPLAQGYITLLFGNAVHMDTKYNGMNKTYRFQTILGVSTRSYDSLGRITNIREISYDQAMKFMNTMLDIANTDIEQTLPPYSAYRYKGKPLWKHANENTLPDPLPTKNVTIYDVSCKTRHPIECKLNKYRSDAIGDILEFRKNNPGATFDFKNIISDWNETQDIILWKLTFKTTVSSGTFIRALVHDVSKIVGIPAHCFRITRLKYHDV